MLRLVACLPRERELHVDLACRRDPPGGALGGLELVLEREQEQLGNGEVGAGLGGARAGGDAIERGAVLGVELGDEGFSGERHRGRGYALCIEAAILTAMSILSSTRGRLFAALMLAGPVAGVAASCGDEKAALPALSGNDESNDASVGQDAATPLADGGQDGGPPNTKLSPTFVHRDVNHVLSTGQSLSVGATGTPPISTSQPFANLMFANGAIPGATNLTAFAPLIEGRVADGTNPDVETMSAGLANLVTKMARDELLVGQPADKTSHDLLVSVHGIGGTAYSGLKKGTGAFAAGMEQAKAGFNLAKALGKSYVVRAVTTVHGETDHVENNAAYENNLLEWQADYEKDVKALTGQYRPDPADPDADEQLDDVRLDDERDPAGRSSRRTSTAVARSSSSGRSTICRIRPTACTSRTRATDTWVRTTRRRIDGSSSRAAGGTRCGRSRSRARAP